MALHFDISKIDEPEVRSLPFFSELDPMEETISIGLKFWQIYDGFTRTGHGQVSKIWEVVNYIGNDIYECKLLSDNTVGELNANYTEYFTDEQIQLILFDNPIVNKNV